MKPVDQGLIIRVQWPQKDYYSSLTQSNCFCPEFFSGPFSLFGLLFLQGWLVTLITNSYFCWYFVQPCVLGPVWLLLDLHWGIVGGGCQAKSRSRSYILELMILFSTSNLRWLRIKFYSQWRKEEMFGSVVLKKGRW